MVLARVLGDTDESRSSIRRQSHCRCTLPEVLWTWIKMAVAERTCSQGTGCCVWGVAFSCGVAGRVRHSAVG